MLRKTAVLLTAIVALLGSGGAALAYTPDPGPIFNNPRGDRAAKDRILRHLVRTISSTPRDSTIRIAAYSNDRPDVVDALIAAHRRGVDVQIVLNDNWTSSATRRLIRVVGRNPDRRSFVAICEGSCRGGPGNQHMKFFLFTRAGQARNVVMVGSANLTGYGARTQWNDMYTTRGNADLLELYATVFEQLVRDRRVAEPYLRRTVGPFENEFGPYRGATEENDPVMRRLRAVRCATVAGFGRNGHTQIRITMYGWVGERGRYLAEQVADLDRRGCEVQVLVSAGGRQVVGTLKRGGVQVKTPDLDLDHNPETGFGETPYEVFTHQKYMTLDGGFRGAMGHQVWTGSENWSGLGLMNDEVTIRIPRRGAHDQYVANFNLVWRTWSRWL